MKKIIIVILACILLGAGGLFLFKDAVFKGTSDEDAVIQQTYDISKKYVALRYQTEHVLVNAKSFGSYDAWNDEMSEVIKNWEALDKAVSVLETSATNLTATDTSFSLVSPAFAYTTQEVSSIINRAPMGKQVSTLAKHLGVDVKLAQLILNQTQDEISREAYAGEGDVFETCEQNSMRIKNGAKVTIFVGGVVMTGGTSSIAASGALAKTALVVSGADLALEVADDEAKIALGDKNKVSEMVGKLRTVTEPAASILTIVNMPGNLSKGIEKLSAVSFGADQVRSVVQDEKVLGISIKVDEKGEVKAEIAGLSQEELPKWREENNGVKSQESVEEIISNAIKVEEKEEAEKEGDTNQPEEKVKTTEVQGADIPNQIYKIVNVSGTSYMMDACLSSTCWDDLDADPVEDRDLGGIYTLGKVFANGESFRSGFRPPELKASGKLTETSANSYKITIYLAIAPFEGPKHKTIEYGTWQNHSIEISANYGDEPVIEWDGSSLKQAK